MAAKSRSGSSRSAQEGYVRLRLGNELKRTVQLLSSRQDWPSLSAYLRHLVARGVNEDLQRMPALHLDLRPSSTVFRMTGAGGLQPLGRSQGGERVWVISVMANLPSSLGGGLGYVCDVVAGDGGGLEARGVVVREEDCR